MDLEEAHKKFQEKREAEGKSLFGFIWLDACADRDAWRQLVG